MNIDDILYIDDNQKTQHIIKRIAIFLGLKLRRIDSIGKLEEYLTENTARCYIMEFLIPRNEKLKAEPIAGEIIEVIRRYDPPAQIIMHSAHEKAEEFAKKENLGYRKKAVGETGLLLREIANKIKT